MVLVQFFPYVTRKTNFPLCGLKVFPKMPKPESWNLCYLIGQKWTNGCYSVNLVIGKISWVI